MGKLRKRTFTGALTSEISEREIAHRPIARRAAEGFVLLKNENNVLPLAKGSKVGLYDVGAANFDITSEEYLNSSVGVYNQARKDWADLLRREAKNDPMGVMGAYMKNAFMIPAGNPIDEAILFSICRLDRKVDIRILESTGGIGLR